MKFRSVYDGKRVRIQHSFKAPEGDITNPLYIDRTKQQFKDGTNINNIVALHPNLDPNNVSERELSGILNNPELYGEYDSELTFEEAMNVVNRAKEQFDTLPAPLRRRFNENPYKFLQYVNNKENHEEMKKFGLLKPEIPVTNIPVETPITPVIQPEQPAVTQQSQAVEPSAK